MLLQVSESLVAASAQRWIVRSGRRPSAVDPVDALAVAEDEEVASTHACNRLAHHSRSWMELYD